MATKPHPVALSKGLDLVTPPMMAEPGSLVDCLNYEVTDTAGYRRIDGYEKYDGFPNGTVYEFYRVGIQTEDPGEQFRLGPGQTINRTGIGGSTFVGVIVGGPYAGNTYDIVPKETLDAFVTDEDYLTLEDDTSFLTLESELGVLKLIADDAVLGNDFVIGSVPVDTTWTLPDVNVTVLGTPIPGRGIYSGMDYINKIRDYSAVLRSNVVDLPTPIAGLYWFDDRLMAAVNALQMTYTIASGGNAPKAGMRLRWNGVIYRLVSVDLISAASIDSYVLSMYPIGTSVTVNDDLVEVPTDEDVSPSIFTWISDVADNGLATEEDSLFAVMGYFRNPRISDTKGFTYIAPSAFYHYTAGTWAGGGPPPITLDLGEDPVDKYYLTNADGTQAQVRIAGFTEDSGSFSAGTAAGTIELVVIKNTAGHRDYVISGDVIRTGSTAGAVVFTVGAVVATTRLAGTGSLKIKETKYQWNTFNFYGQSSTRTAYGTTGASRAFWTTKTAYGNIITEIDNPAIGYPFYTNDLPKYLAFHANTLALAFGTGSIQFSVVGTPYSFDGLLGAAEIATGDDITGLLELPGDTLAIFGRRTIRKVTGSSSDEFALGTISGNSGCFDYTACLVGSDAVFCNTNGVSTLQQTAAYGDFVGKRVSDKINNWLRPKLSKTGLNIENGGVAMAYTVRTKNQYRLVLLTGETIIFTMMGEEPAITFADYSLTGQARVPLAWSTEISSRNSERIHVVWTDPSLSKSVFELESGWGFNGSTFNHYFDLCPLFDTMSANYYQITAIRMYGTGYGIASLNVKTAGIEEDFQQPYHDTLQDISMPRNPETLYVRQKNVTNIIDQANWGLGVKVRIQGSNPENTTSTEPSHTCQVLVLHEEITGAEDN